MFIMCKPGTQKVEEGLWLPGTGVMGDWLQVATRVLGTEPSPLWEHQVILTWAIFPDPQSTL